MIKKFLLFTILSAFLSFPLLIDAQNVLGENVVFNIEPTYDASRRSQLTASLLKISPTVYWYVDNSWWEELTEDQQAEAEQSIDLLTEEFETNAYTKLTRTFGSEWSPGIDKDTRITVLIHPTKKGTGGYNNSADGYPKAQIPESNEREMIYLGAQHINTANAKVFLAHEFVHLITFNQKNKLYGVSEEVWLNEARAEYSATLLGYNEDYSGSNLERRVRDFLEKPSDSLTEWRDTHADYGVVNLFTQYLVDHYGINILTDSLKMRKTGIESLNTVLFQYGFREDFSQIFTDWTITVLINDCEVSEKYCYYDQNLKNFRVTPLVNYLPFVGQSTLLVTNTTKDWAGNWHKFIGGRGTLNLTFTNSGGANFTVPYIIQDLKGNLSVEELSLGAIQSGEIFVSDFGSENISLTIIPIVKNKISNFGSLEPSRTFFWSASTKEEKEQDIPSLSPQIKPISKMTKAELLARITEIMSVISQLQVLLSELTGEASCERIAQNLYFGMRDDPQVRCLQEFLKNQGPAIYPEGITNGNFFTLTQQAVIRFQEKYADEILAPVGLTSGSGFVGASTRAKINQLLLQ